MGEDAVVVGAGIGGLAAAAALSPHFEKVTVFDKDAIGGEAVRMGVGQGAHAHMLLAAGARAMENIAPGLGEAFDIAGASSLRIGLDIDVFDFVGQFPQVDPGFSVRLLSRPHYEAAVRSRVLALGNIEIAAETAVERFLVNDGRCTGVELTDGRVVGADLVVDSSGMNAPLAARLMTDGEADFETEAVKINMSYTSAMFAKPPAFRGEERAFYFLPGAPNTAFALLFPVEDDNWIVSLGMRGQASVPRDLEGFLAFAKALPGLEIHDRIAEATPLGEIKTFRKTFATRRKFGSAAKWPGRLIALGDAMTSFNPTFGQGMTVAALQAAALNQVLAAGANLDTLGSAYFPPAEAIAAGAWALAITTDYSYPETEGERPEGFAQAQAGALIARRLCETDADFAALRLRVVHMLESPAVFRQSPWAERIEAAVAAARSAAMA